jgi:hypothetical protein
MMRQLFLVQTHKNPDQLRRLVHTLRAGCPGSVVLVSHHHRAEPLPPSLFAGLPDVAVIAGDGGRGDFSILDGYLAALRWARDNKIDYDWLTNLSGQDYPASSLQAFSQELSDIDTDGFLHHFDALRADPLEMFPMSWPPRHGHDRYCYQYTKLKDELSLAERAVLRLPRLAIERLTDRLRIKTAYGLMVGRPAGQTPFGPEFHCYAGSYWHTIRRACAEHILDFVEAKPDVVAYFRRVMIPDESFIQTVLVNHAGFRFENDNRRYFDMRGSRFGHPRVLTEDDLPAFAGRRYVFARKIELERGSALVDVLDRYALT